MENSKGDNQDGDRKQQSLIVEGCYIPFDWQKDFDEDYLKEIRYYCLVMTENYIETHFADILKYESVIEQRLYAGNIEKADLIAESQRILDLCKKHNLNYISIDDSYEVRIDL